MSEKVEHKMIDPRECPRCGSHNTDCLGDEGTSTVSYLCRDCDAKNPEADGESPGYYEVIYVDVIGSVIWTDGNGQEREVHDTEYLHYLAAKDLLHVCEELLEQVTGPAMVYGDGRGNDGQKTGLSHQEFNALRDRRISAARAVIVQAKGQEL